MPARRKPLKFADMHCGVGSLRLAFEMIGAECVWSFTADTQAERCYRENFGDGTFHSDATDIAAHDILVANLDECRASAKRHASARHTYDTVLDIICLRRPSACLLAGVSATANGASIRTVIDELARLGYFVRRATLDARGFGLPQARQTDFVVAFDRETGFQFPAAAEKTVSIDGLLDPNPADRYYISDADRDRLIARRGRSVVNGNKWRLGFVTHGCANELRDAPDSTFHNILIVPDGRWRMLTEREAARLQGISDKFVLHPDRRKAQKQLARCVPLPCAAAVAECIVAELRPGRAARKARPRAKVVGDGHRSRKSHGLESEKKRCATSSPASPLRWYGSLNGYAKRIVGLLPKHESYCDVFGGSAAILLSKPPSTIETYNDIDENLHTFWSVVREPHLRSRLIEMVELTPFGRAQFRDCLSDQGDPGDPVKRAWSFLVICNQARNGRGVNESDWAYNKTRGGGNRNAWAKLPQRLAEVGRRLKPVQVENLPFEDVMRRYDSRDTLFLLDPPYLPETRASGTRYTHECSRADHIRLLRIACHVKAMVAVCSYRNGLYDEMLEGWRRTNFRGKSYAGPRSKGCKLPQRVLSIYTNYDPPSR